MSYLVTFPFPVEKTKLELCIEKASADIMKELLTPLEKVSYTVFCIVSLIISVNLNVVCPVLSWSFSIERLLMVMASWGLYPLQEGRRANNYVWNGVTGMATNTWKLCVWCVRYHSINTIPAITMSPSSPIKVPVVSTHQLCLFTGTWTLLEDGMDGNDGGGK